MESILIADDEKNIREGLKYIVDWEAMGFQVDGEASNGEEALQYILEKKPALVLLDIRMPKLYGTDIIRIAREHGYSGNFIILSGYSDFVYAQTAIQYGVKYYLTKPLDEDELAQAVHKIGNEIREKKDHVEYMKRYRKKAKHVFLHEIVTGIWNPDEEQLSIDEIEEMQLCVDSYQIAIYEKFSIRPEDPQYDFAELLDVANRGNHCFEHFSEDGNEVILLKGEYARQKFQKIMDRYEQMNLQEGSPLDSIFISYGRTVGTLDEIYLSYEEALGLLRRRFFCMQGQHTMGYEELPHIDNTIEKISRQQIDLYSRQISDYIMTSNRNQVVETLSEVEKYLYHVDNEITEIKYFLVDLYLQIKERILLITQRQDLPFCNNGDAIKYIGECHYLYEIILFLSEQMMSIMNALNHCERDTIMEDVLYYIDHNFQNPIKLEGIAPLFGYNSAYLGKIFTKTVGESFHVYLDRKRVEKSKELLEAGNLKVYEIAKLVGYGNVDYFHKKFKKYTGISPAEYRKNMEKEVV